MSYLNSEQNSSSNFSLSATAVRRILQFSQISNNTPRLLPPPPPSTFCISAVLNFAYDECNTQEKSHCLGGGGVGELQTTWILGSGDVQMTNRR